MAWFEHGATRIYYEDGGDGDPVLLLPGFAGRIEEFTTLRAALLSSGYRVIAADLPGSGRSLPQPRRYPVTFYQDDARSFAALLQHLAIGPVHLLGFSDGGEVVLLIAAMYANLVRSVVTWGAEGQRDEQSVQMADVMYRVVDTPIPPLQPFRDYLVSTYGESNARIMTQSAATAVKEIVKAGGDISLSMATDIACPVLLITGEHDIFVSMTRLSKLANHIPIVEVSMAEGAGHKIHHDTPQWLEQTILNWLGRH